MIYSPFCADLPHTVIFTCMFPDVLPQLHKGVFKDHFMKWHTTFVGHKAIDHHFHAMSGHPQPCHFKKGISSVIKWTRKEHKEMHSSSTFGCSAWTSGFYLFCPVQSHTLDTLWQMEEALNTFHANTDIFLDKGIHENFDILKLHLIFH